MKYQFLALTIVFFLASCGGQKAPDVQQPQEMQPRTGPSAALGQAYFRECAVCHNAAKGAPHKIGPNLWNIYGKKAGQRSDFSYSRAMERSQIIWGETTLDAYIENPQSMILGNRMSYLGNPNPEQRKDLIAFLKTRKDLPDQ